MKTIDRLGLFQNGEWSVSYSHISYSTFLIVVNAKVGAFSYDEDLLVSYLKGIHRGNANVFFFRYFGSIYNGVFMRFNRIAIAKKLILAEKFKKAKSLLAPIAKKGHSKAQLIMGYLYFGGDMNMSSKETKYWLTKAAEQGLSESQHDLGVMWMTGEAGYVDIEKSLYWYQRCVDRDHNVVDTEWAFKRIIEIYEGKFGEQYKNLEAVKTWQLKRVAFLTVPYRNHPDWFYQKL